MCTLCALAGQQKKFFVTFIIIISYPDFAQIHIFKNYYNEIENPTTIASGVVVMTCHGANSRGIKIHEHTARVQFLMSFQSNEHAIQHTMQ